MRQGVEGNGDHGAKALGDDALRGLEVGVANGNIFCDYGGLPVRGETQGGLTWCDGGGRQRRTTLSTSEPDPQRTFRIGFDQNSAVCIGDRDRVIEHRAKDCVQRQMRMQEHGRFEEQAQLLQSSRSGAGGIRSRNAAQEALKRRVGRRGPENNLIGIFQAERDDVRVSQRAALDSFPVYKDAPALALIFESVTIALGDNRRALPRDAPILELDVVARLAAAANQKRRLRNRHDAARAIWRNHFEDGLAAGVGAGLGFRHWCGSGTEL